MTDMAGATRSRVVIVDESAEEKRLRKRRRKAGLAGRGRLQLRQS
jgi:hypothetical protein